MKRAVYYPLIVVCLILGLVLGGCGPTKLPSGPDAVWDLVVIGDSSLWGHGEAIAKQIEKDMGVKVNLEDFALPVLSAGKVREALETGKSANVRLEKLPEAVKNAEMVVMFTNPRDSVLPWGTTEMDACFESGDPGPDACSSTYFDMYTADLKAIWQKIIALREGQETILIATDIYNPLAVYWQTAGVFDNCNRCWEGMSAAARNAAEAVGVPFVSRLDLYNGADHTEDPVAKGYISDGEHPSELGAQVSAEAFAEIGYEPFIP